MKATKTRVAKVIGALLGLTALTSVALATDGGDVEGRREAPEWVRVRNVAYAGTGCQAGSDSNHQIDGAAALDILWDSFTAEAGLGVPLSEGRKNCQILIDLAYPHGWTYTVDEVDLGGYVSLESGVTAQVQAAYYFQGQAETARLTTSLRGPEDRDFLVRDGLGQNATVWAPCGAQRALNVNFTARVSNAGAALQGGHITLETPTFNLRWKRCER